MAEVMMQVADVSQGRVRLMLAYDDVTGITSAFQLEADPGEKGIATFHLVLPPNFDQTRQFSVLASGGVQGRERINIPSARRWNMQLDPETNLPTADFPAGSVTDLSWAPDLSVRRASK